MIRPLQDMIVVKPDPEKKSFLIGVSEDTLCGEVVAIGPGKKMPDGKIRRMLVNIGDRVMYSGTIDTKFDDFLLMKDRDVIGLV